MPVYHAGDGNQFMGVVELPKGAIVELKFSIDKKPTEYAIKRSTARGRAS